MRWRMLGHLCDIIWLKSSNCLAYLALIDIFVIHKIKLKFSFSLISQERFRVGAFAGGSAAELPSLEEELAQVFYLFVAGV